MDYILQNTGVDSLSLLQGVFPTQGLDPGLPTLQVHSLPAALKGKPKDTGVSSLSLLPFPAKLPDPEIEPGSPALQAESLPTELLGKPRIFRRIGSNFEIKKKFIIWSNIPKCLKDKFKIDFQL